MGTCVTPRVGVWIETFTLNSVLLIALSLPAWECGLKHFGYLITLLVIGHSPRGSVD